MPTTSRRSATAWSTPTARSTIPSCGRESLNIFPASAANKDVPFPTPLFTIVLDKKFITPYTQNWSLTVERELRGNFVRVPVTSARRPRT